MSDTPQRGLLDTLGVLFVLGALFACVLAGLGREYVGQVGAALGAAPALVTVQNADGTGWRSNGPAPTSGCAPGNRYNPSTGARCP